MAKDNELLHKISNNQVFNLILEKVTLNRDLTYPEKTYILSVGILFLEEYLKDKRLITYLDFSYYLFLKYALITNDYKPLYDFSINIGFYPIVDVINKCALVTKNIDDYIINFKITSEFRHEREGYIETLEQHNNKKKFLEEINGNEKCYIAPTSFGKSSLIIEYINSIGKDAKKIGIIVPTKSLLLQTYKSIKKHIRNKKIIIHNEMYTKEDNTFIGILTQERALKLIADNDIYFDVLIIDEAHNLIDYDRRNILLSRLIKINIYKNIDTKLVYLSPLLKNGDVLKVNKNQEIASYKIDFNIKEPEFFEYNKKMGAIYSYNRFTDQFYKKNEEFVEQEITYIKNNSKNKNFIYINSPKKIENFINNNISSLDKINPLDLDIIGLKNILRKQVHKDFYMIETLDYGLIYLHGKLPDIIKEYIEYKFKTLGTLKYVVANTVILEGINLPIDNLFIYDDYGLDGKSLINLIGRVNRLNEIFSSQDNNLWKLLSNIHLFYKKVDTKGEHHTKFKTYLRNRIFDDKIMNPLLEGFNIDEAKKEKQKDHRDTYIAEMNLIQENERFLLKNLFTTENEDIKKYFIQNGINFYFKNIDQIVDDFLERKTNNAFTFDDYQESNDDFRKNNQFIINKIYYYFFKNETNISDYEFIRLKEKNTRIFYTNYTTINSKRTLSQNINSLLKYFKRRVKEGDGYFYIGEGYGEVPNPTKYYHIKPKNVYINLTDIINDEKKLVNLALVKLKIEDDFVSFHLSKFIETLFYFKLISNDEYDLFFYGINDIGIIKYIKAGLSIPIALKLQDDGQLNNNIFIEGGEIKTTKNFYEYLNTLDDFRRFEIERML